MIGKEKEETYEEVEQAELPLSSLSLSYESLEDFCVVKSVTDGDTIKM